MNQLIIVILVCSFCAYLIFNFGSHFLSRKVREQIYIDMLISQNEDRVWLCLEVIEDHHGGPFGSFVRKLLLENSKERILLCYHLEDIKKGTYVKLQKRTEEERPCTWISATDRVMIPRVVS